MAQRTWAAGAPLELLELPTPEPRRHEVRVRVQAIGVNPVDWKMRSHGPLRWAARLLGPRPPVIVGVDFAGVVDAVGPAVTDLAVGDRVAGGTNFARGQRGSYADTVLVRRDQVCRVPDSVDITAAAALPIPGVTAWMSVIDLGRIRRVPMAERRVLVLGASGGVGQLVVQIAKRENALVCGVCSSANVDRVAGLGADVVIDYTGGDALAQARAHGPFSVVVDCAGGYSARRCRALLAPGGRHVMVAGDDAAALAARVLAPRRSKGILGRPTGARLAPLLDAVAAGSLRVTIAQAFPLADAEEAHRLSRTGRMTGKLLLIPDAAPAPGFERQLGGD
ncbi:NAD(P)-dependent alcohol dehydrogenase [Mycolicibacterium cosmeticum]|uniref:Oxidoreductase n=1 Tax=Mycolicibacterium cosmeticum TaxID=258533 RepID=W9AWQ3_MYCCO|nr:NAD(P)-dependent alcohol dehydrogenase [Mycolicibacterium cosmeticum]CDO07016.1 oxidoreductase [Mycolicibacterium cosmeticum]